MIGVSKRSKKGQVNEKDGCTERVVAWAAHWRSLQATQVLTTVWLALGVDDSLDPQQ